jgi:hypothetical protein
MDEPILPEAQVNGTSAVGTTDGSEAMAQPDRSDAPSTSHGALMPTFLAGLAAAMREAAVRERERIAGVVAQEATAHVEKVRSRATVETEELRRLAEEDVEHIQQWSASEIERIQGEATQKIDDRRSSLDVYLKQHDTIIETEIKGVDGAVRDYEATLDRFFAELSEVTDPAEIVRRAGQLPAPPDLDEIRATARANAMARLAESETEPVQASAEAAPVEAVAEAAPAEAVAEMTPAEPVAEAAPPEAVAVAAPVETVEAVASIESSGSGDDGTMAGVMDDGAGSIEPAESTESTETTGAEVASAEEGAPVATETEREETPPLPEPVAVMDPDTQRTPSWPAPAPGSEAPQLAPTIDNTSAAVRLLRSVAPWTAPTHAGNRAESDSD